MTFGNRSGSCYVSEMSPHSWNHTSDLSYTQCLRRRWLCQTFSANARCLESETRMIVLRGVVVDNGTYVQNVIAHRCTLLLLLICWIFYHDVMKEIRCWCRWLGRSFMSDSCRVGRCASSQTALSWRREVLLEINHCSATDGRTIAAAAAAAAAHCPSVSDRYSVGMATSGRQVNSRGSGEPHAPLICIQSADAASWPASRPPARWKWRMLAPRPARWSGTEWNWLVAICDAVTTIWTGRLWRRALLAEHWGLDWITHSCTLTAQLISPTHHSFTELIVLMGFRVLVFVNFVFQRSSNYVRARYC